MVGWGAFVGREHELSRLRKALADRTRLVLVVGDAGIGKTRFVAESLRRSPRHGMLAVGGGCLPLVEKLPLLPVADALTELSQLDGGAPFEAALAAAPPYVRPELARLMPRLTAGEPAVAEPVEHWRHERLFAGVAELLDGVARRSRLVLLVEDVHWSDDATLDFLTYLVRPSRQSAVSVVVTCRSDEVPLDAGVADWLAQMRRDAGVAEIRLGPLSHREAVDQILALVETPPTAELVEQVYTRAEGHPFFTEQLVAAAVTDSGRLAPPVALPARLAELLAARTVRCGAAGRAVLVALAVAGRPLSEGLLGEVAELDPAEVQAAVRELAEARLLASPAGGGHRLRHALLAEAVGAELMPGERVSLHERVARALEGSGGEALAAEAAGHWAAAGRSGEELRARLAAASAAEQVFAYADAAGHWQRAIELYEAGTDADLADEVDWPRLYIHAVDALEASGDRVRAGVFAEDAYRRFADHPDRVTAASIHYRAGHLRASDSPAAGGPLMREALRLFDGTPPSLDHARALLGYALDFLFVVEGRHPAEIHAVLESGLEVAEAAGALTVTAPILCMLAMETFVRGEVEEGFRLLAQARSVLGESRDARAVLPLAILESDALLKVGRLEDATRVGLRGFDEAGELGFGSTGPAAISLANAVEGLLGRGRTAEAAALIDPLINGPIDPDNWPLHLARAEIDLVRGDLHAAADRMAKIDVGASPEFAAGLAQDVAEVALWAGRPGNGLEEVHRALKRKGEEDWLMKSGPLLVVGMRSCAELAERARAHRDDNAVRAALAAANNLVSWVNQEHDVPFTDHPYVATIPAARATWDAEHGRVAGPSDPAAWSVAAERWEALDYRHRAAYARWRQAEGLLGRPHGGREAATVLATAANLAVEHVPLTTEIQDLARRARIDLSAAATPPGDQNGPPPARALGLTDRELDVLRLLGQGKTNPEIAAALFISPRTAGVHVTHILRKLDATTRVQAATVAERAGLLHADPKFPAAT
jgi:DNA-binding CsgD family transcriptional regulator